MSAAELRGLTLVQNALGETWVLYDVGLLVAMIVCLITYTVYVQIMADFQPQYSYEVYDSLGGAQARLLLPKKLDPAFWNSKHLGADYVIVYISCLTHALIMFAPVQECLVRTAFEDLNFCKLIVHYSET